MRRGDGEEGRRGREEGEIGGLEREGEERVREGEGEDG